MTDTVLSLSPNGMTSNVLATPFSVGNRYRVECCPEEGLTGFCVEVRDNLMNFERDQLEAATDDIAVYNKAWLATPDDERDHSDTPARRELTLIAPYIRAWNAVGIDTADGQEKPIPPPAEAGPQVFDLLEQPMTNWLRITIIRGYLTGKGFSWFSRALRSSLATTSDGEPTDDDDPS